MRLSCSARFWLPNCTRGIPLIEGFPPRQMLRIQSYIDANLQDSGARPRVVAGAHYMSLRSLHGIFADSGHTVAEWIRTRRLEHCRRDLADAFQRQVPVGASARAGAFPTPPISAGFSALPTACRPRHSAGSTSTPEARRPVKAMQDKGLHDSPTVVTQSQARSALHGARLKELRFKEEIAMTATTNATETKAPGLGKRRLGVPSLVFMIIAASAPLTVVAGGVTSNYAVTGVLGIPLSFIVLGIVLLVFAVGYTAMSQHVQNAGAFYAYVARGLGKPAGSAPPGSR